MNLNSPLKPISELIALGKKIEANWSLEKFPELASSALIELNYKFSLDELEAALSEWLVNLPKLPKQVNLYNAFGEPSISLFNNDQFSVDLYFWRKNDTLIHSHAFRGAFKVLYGHSLHEEFQVETRDSSGSDVLNSRVSKSKLEILKTGETRTIWPGMKLVHRILHLDNPTVTLCIRTVNDTALSQWHHLTSGISYQQRNTDELTIKRILYFQFLFNANPTSANLYLNKILDLLPASSQLSLYEGLFKNDFGLDQEVTEFLIDHVRSRFVDSSWFTQYEDHYLKMERHLFESQASSGSLKLLAHALNCNYSHEEVEQLLMDYSGEDLKDLCQQLLKEEPIFHDAHFEYQQEMIQNFVKG